MRDSKQIPIWPGAAPDPLPVRGSEIAQSSGTQFIIAGKSVVGVSSVTLPTMAVYPPKEHNTGVIVIVFPGGGYQTLAVDLEGVETCDWLTDHDITCVVLKYRVTNIGSHPKSGPHPEAPQAVEDVQRARMLTIAR